MTGDWLINYRGASDRRLVAHLYFGGRLPAACGYVDLFAQFALALPEQLQELMPDYTAAEPWRRRCAKCKRSAR